MCEKYLEIYRVIFWRISLLVYIYIGINKMDMDCAELKIHHKTQRYMLSSSDFLILVKSLKRRFLSDLLRDILYKFPVPRRMSNQWHCCKTTCQTRRKDFNKTNTEGERWSNTDTCSSCTTQKIQNGRYNEEGRSKEAPMHG